MLYVVLGIASGASVVLSRMVNAGLGQRIGVYHSTRMNYITGLCVSLLALLIVREPMPVLAPVTGLRSVVMYCGGLLGVVTVVLSNIITPRLSAFVLTLIIFISQFSTGMLLDLLREGALSPGQIAGAGIMLAGLILYNRPEAAKSPPAKQPGGEGE